VSGCSRCPAVRWAVRIAATACSMVAGARPETLRAAHVEHLVADLVAEGRGDVTVRRVHSTLRAALSYAVRTRRLTSNPARNIGGVPKANRPQVTPWTAAELATFLRHVEDDRLGALYEVIAACGLRRGEALACAGSTWTSPAA